jgi:hypothetical protein
MLLTLRQLARVLTSWECPKCHCHNADGDIACAYCDG